MMKRIALLSALALVIGTQAMAAGGMSARSAKKFGVLGNYRGFSGTVGTYLGADLAFNLGGVARIGAGYTYLSAPTPVASAITGSFNLFVPMWSLSPTAGFRYDFLLTTPSTSRMSVDLGLEWTTRVGLVVGGGVNYGLSGNGAARMITYATLGWFFGKGK